MYYWGFCVKYDNKMATGTSKSNYKAMILLGIPIDDKLLEY